MIIDSHSHLNHPDFINNIDKYIKEAAENNVKGFLCVGWDLKSSIAATNIANKYKNVYAAVGIHPSDIKTMKENDIDEIEKLLINKKIIAIGEIGLDFYWEKDKKEQAKQKEYFIKFIKLANKHGLPIVVHSRDAINATYEIIKKNKVNKGGIMHCYAAGKQYVKNYVELGFYFGIGGVVTFKNALNVKEAVIEMPIDRILLESDAPYLTPVPFRGTANHSKYIPLTLKSISEIKEIDEKTIENITTNNFKNLFRETF